MLERLFRILHIMRTGRPTILKPRVMFVLCDAVRRGLTYDEAAAVARISQRTLYAWLRRGREERSGPYRALFEALNLAIADYEIRCLTVARQARKRTRR